MCTTNLSDVIITKLSNIVPSVYEQSFLGLHIRAEHLPICLNKMK